MRSVLKITMAPILSLVTIMLGISYFNTFISLKMTNDGFNSFITGALYSAYYTGMMLGAIYLERIIQKKGHIRSFCIFASIAGCCIVVQSFTEPSFFWVGLRFISGVAVSGIFIVIESWLLLLASAKTQGVILSVYMIALYTAMCIGQFGIITVPLDSIMPYNLALIFCIASILPVCMMKASAPTLPQSHYINVFYILKKIPLGFFGVLTSGLLISSFYALGPVYAEDSGFSLSQISIIMATTIFGGMALQWPIGKLSDLFERRLIILLVATFTSFISFALVFSSSFSFPLLLILLFIYGGFVFTLYPITITYCCDFFSSSGITSVIAAALLIFGFGCIIGPLITPLFFFLFGPVGLFWYSSIIAALLSLFTYYQKHKIPNEQKESKETFHIQPGNTGKYTDGH